MNWKPAHLKVGLLNSSRDGPNGNRTYSTFTFQLGLPAQKLAAPFGVSVFFTFPPPCRFGSTQKVPEQFDPEAGTSGGRPVTPFKLTLLKMRYILDFHIPASSYTSKPPAPFGGSDQNCQFGLSQKGSRSNLTWKPAHLEDGLLHGSSRGQ